MDVVGTHIFQTIVMARPDDEDNDGRAGESLRFTPVHRAYQVLARVLSFRGGAFIPF